MGTSISQLPAAIPLSVNDLLPLRQVDNIDRNISLGALSGWLASRLSPGLAVGPYYVDSVAGNDAADGLSAAAAKKSIKGACDAVPPCGVATIYLLNSAAAYNIDNDIYVESKRITLSGPSSANKASVQLVARMTNGLNSGFGFLAYRSEINFLNCTLKCPAFLDASKAASYGSLIKRADNTSATIQLFLSDIVLNDVPLAHLASGGQFLALRMYSSVLTNAAANNPSPILADLGGQLLEISTNSCILPAGKTWKSILQGLVYDGISQQPNNVLHNLGSAITASAS